MIKLDHVVYFTNKTPLEIVEEQKEMDWHAIIGGSHEKWGTHNALMYLGNAYVEWLSVKHQDMSEKSNHQLIELLLRDIEKEENWGNLCFSVSGIDLFKDRIRSIGFETSGVLNAERKTISRDVLKWEMLFVDEQPSDNLPLPFFIEWQELEDVCFNKLREEGTIISENEKLEITECIFNVNNPRIEAKKWAKLISVRVTEGNTINLPNVILKFTEKEFGSEKERLTEVVIEHTRTL